MTLQKDVCRERRELASRLSGPGKALEFVAGQSKLRRGDQLRVSVDPLRDPEGRKHDLVTVSTAFPPPEWVQGLPFTLRNRDSGQIVRVGQTDRQGQVWLSDLPPGRYNLQFEGLVVGLKPVSIGGMFAASYGAALRPSDEQGPDRGLEQEFHDGPVRAALRINRAGQLVLQVAVDPAEGQTLAGAFAQFRIYDHRTGTPLMVGYLGLYDDASIGRGQINLSAIDPTIRERTADSEVDVHVVTPESLTAADEPQLLSSLAGTSHPISRVILEDALRRAKG